MAETKIAKSRGDSESAILNSQCFQPFANWRLKCIQESVEHDREAFLRSRAAFQGARQRCLKERGRCTVRLQPRKTAENGLYRGWGTTSQMRTRAMHMHGLPCTGVLQLPLLQSVQCGETRATLRLRALQLCVYWSFARTNFSFRPPQRDWGCWELLTSPVWKPLSAFARQQQLEVFDLFSVTPARSLHNM
jgi:hypothetical protein